MRTGKKNTHFKLSLKKKIRISQIFHLNRSLAPSLPAGIPKHSFIMIYNDDCDVLVEKYFPETTLVGLAILLKFLAESLQNPKISTHLSLGPSKSDTTRNFRLI